MRRYDIILMDADDTLFDFEQAEAEALRQLFAQYGIPYTEHKVHTYQSINDSLWKQFEIGSISKTLLLDTRFGRFFEAIDLQADGVQANIDYLNFLAEGAFLLPGALSLCREIQTLGCKLYICTNGVTRVQKHRLSISEIAPFCDGIFVSEEAGAQKPQQGYFDYVFVRLGQPDPSRVLMVGDSLSSDIQGAVSYGLPCCWLNRKGLSTNLPVTYTVTTVEAIGAVIRGS